MSRGKYDIIYYPYLGVWSGIVSLDMRPGAGRERGEEAGVVVHAPVAVAQSYLTQRTAWTGWREGRPVGGREGGREEEECAAAAAAAADLLNLRSDGERSVVGTAPSFLLIVFPPAPLPATYGSALLFYGSWAAGLGSGARFRCKNFGLSFGLRIGLRFCLRFSLLEKVQKWVV